MKNYKGIGVVDIFKKVLEGELQLEFDGSIFNNISLSKNSVFLLNHNLSEEIGFDDYDQVYILDGSDQEKSTLEEASLSY